MSSIRKRVAIAPLTALLLGPPGLTQASSEPLTVRIGFANVGADNRQFSGGSVAHSEHYLDQEFKDQSNVKIEWSFFKGAGPAVNEALANNQLDFAIQGDLPEIIGRANGLKTKLLLASVRTRRSIWLCPPARRFTRSAICAGKNFRSSAAPSPRTDLD